jgi:hypothetical protein
MFSIGLIVRSGIGRCTCLISFCFFDWPHILTPVA